MWLRLGAHGSVAVLDSQQAYYRLHRENMSVQYRGIRHLLEIRAAFDTLFAEYGHRLRDCERLKELARRHLADRFFWQGHHWFDQGNLAGCDECLVLVRKTCPSFCYRPEWFRLKCKRLMGHGLWSRLRPFVRHPLLRNLRRAV